VSVVTGGSSGIGRATALALAEAGALAAALREIEGLAAPLEAYAHYHAALAEMLQARYGIGVSGVIMVSPVIEFSTIDDDRFAICVDTAWKGASETEGQALFTEAGEQGDLLKEMTPYLETLEAEIQRTRLVGKKLLELDVLREMRFDATLPDGRQHTVDGFLTVDEKKMTELPDNVVGELHRTGVLGLVHLHWVSMGNMRRLVDWHVERSAAETPAA
jgi:hypothetical protein